MDANPSIYNFQVSFSIYDYPSITSGVVSPVRPDDSTIKLVNACPLIMSLCTKYILNSHNSTIHLIIQLVMSDFIGNVSKYGC